MKKLIFVIVFIQLIPLVSLTQILIVPDDYETIQGAVNAATSNDTILIKPGTYFENIEVVDKNIVIGSLFLSTNNEDYIDQTIIDGSNNGRVIFYSGVDSPSQLTGFTIQNGAIEGVNHSGGGIAVYSSPNIELSNLKILENTAVARGAGLTIWSSNASISHVLFKENSATGQTDPPHDGRGGALYFYNSQTNLTNCEFIANSADLGAGIFEHETNNSYLNCIFKDNIGIYPGGGVCTFSGIVNYDKCIFDNNSGDGAIYVEDTKLSVENCLLINNGTAIMGSDSVSIILSNSTIANNDCVFSPIYIHHSSDIFILNSILWNNCVSEIRLGLKNNLHISNTNIRNGIDGIDTVSLGNKIYLHQGIYNMDPHFVDSINYHLADFSPQLEKERIQLK